MDEKTQRFLDRRDAQDQQIAESMAERAIGQAAVTLHTAGQAITAQALVSHLLAAVAQQPPGRLQRLQHEAAARLLGWSAEPSAFP